MYYIFLFLTSLWDLWDMLGSPAIAFSYLFPPALRLYKDVFRYGRNTLFWLLQLKKLGGPYNLNNFTPTQSIFVKKIQPKILGFSLSCNPKNDNEWSVPSISYEVPGLYYVISCSVSQDIKSSFEQNEWPYKTTFL